MSEELTEEERALLAEGNAPVADKNDVPDVPTTEADTESKPKRRARRATATKVEDEEQFEAEEANEPQSDKRGVGTPVQFGDDGWGDVPVQFRN